MADRVAEFLSSHAAGWELTKEEFDDCSHTLFIDHPEDPILVQRGSRYFILNRDYIGRPKVVINNDESDSVEEIGGAVVSGNES